MKTTMNTTETASLIPAKPAHITIETLPQLFAHHRATYGGWSMTSSAPENEPPEGVTPDEWEALGEPGRTALTRERDARQKAEHALAASRARPAPPKKTAQPPAPAQPEPVAPPAADSESIGTAVATAMKPFLDFVEKQQAKDDEREAQEAAGKIVDAVLSAAKGKFVTDETSGAAREFHNPANALSMLDLSTLTDGNGKPDEAKISAELLKVLTNEPHLGKIVDTRRTAAPSTLAGPAGHKAPIDDRVKDTLAKMQQSSGIKPTP